MKKGDPQNIAIIFLGMAASAIMIWIHAPDQVNLEEYEKSIIDIMEKGILK